MIRNKHILVAVLNWGLGHATRSAPIIRQLMNDNNTVTLASDGAALELLSSVFPDLPTIALPGYDVTYPSQSMIWNIGTQLHKINKAIKSEQATIDNWTKNNEVDIIVSDNRYGCHHRSAENIFISHQLNLQVPLASIVNRIHAKMIDRFQQVWIVDDESRKLSGNLSDPKWLSTKTSIKYIGAQSRLNQVLCEKQYDVAAILSGPEPQRTYLEEELLEKLATLNLNAILVQGSQSALKIESTKNLQVLQFADATVLSEIICSSEMIVCRSGYSTIMDLAKLGGQVLFIPTPGQTEQIYLAEQARDQRIAQYQYQGTINIEKAWNTKSNFSGF